MSNMYPRTSTWSPYVGCGNFNCTYCEPSFKAYARRQKWNCMDCYDFTPHCHPKRLSRIPAGNVFVCSQGDISFCPPSFTREIIKAIVKRGDWRPEQTFHFQSKRPECFQQFINYLPETVTLGTTLETNRDRRYREVSQAPLPSERYAQFAKLDWPRKVVTVEPMMAFDPNVFAGWIAGLKPEYVWLGFNSRPKQVTISEPSVRDICEFLTVLEAAKVEVQGKDLRGIEIPEVRK